MGSPYCGILRTILLLNCSLNAGTEYWNREVAWLEKATKVSATRQIFVDHAGSTGARAGWYEDWPRPFSK